MMALSHSSVNRRMSPRTKRSKALALQKIVSGGQTGVDRAALDVALDHDVSCGGWCPRGRLAEDGPIDDRYPLDEAPASEYAERTEWNARDSDGTLVLTIGQPEGGTAFTIHMAKKYRRPCLVIDLTDGGNVKSALEWLEENGIEALNVAGPRGSRDPEVYRLAYDFIQALLHSSLNHS